MSHHMLINKQLNKTIRTSIIIILKIEAILTIAMQILIVVSIEVYTLHKVDKVMVLEGQYLQIMSSIRTLLTFYAREKVLYQDNKRKYRGILINKEKRTIKLALE